MHRNNRTTCVWTEKCDFANTFILMTTPKPRFLKLHRCLPNADISTQS